MAHAAMLPNAPASAATLGDRDAPIQVQAAERPTLAAGVRLVGAARDSGYQVQQWLVQRDTKFIQVTELIYRVLEHADGQCSLVDIAAAVSSATNRAVSADNVRYLIEKRLLPMGLIAADGGAVVTTHVRRTTSSFLTLNVRRRVLRPGAINPFTAVLRVFYVPVVLVAMLVLAGVSQWWIFAVHGLNAGAFEVASRPELLLLLELISIVAGVIHELGHASALRYGGGNVRGIGVGLYLFWPAFYTDVTDAYRLGRWAKVRTDLGGVYFDLLISLGIFAAYLVTRQEYLLLYVLLSDLDILDQFSPFLKFDGYWALADLTGLPDFFVLMGPFLRSVLPIRSWRGPKLPPLKRWVRAVFALYCLVTIPVLVFLFISVVRAAPVVLPLAWQALVESGVGFHTALVAHDAGTMGLEVIRMLSVGLPALGIILTLIILLRMVLRWLRAGFRWSFSHPKVWVALGIGAVCLVVPSSVAL